MEDRMNAHGTIKEFTLGDFFDAMEKNGYPKSNGLYIRRDNNTGEVIEACAFGQAALNMSVEPADLANALSVLTPLPSLIYRMRILIVMLT